MHDFTGRGRSLYVYTKISMENKFSFHWTEPKKHFAESILSLQHQLLSQIPIGLTFHPKRVGAISRTRRRDSDSFRNLIWSFRVFFLGDEKSEFFFGSVRIQFVVSGDFLKMKNVSDIFNHIFIEVLFSF